jgi:hypothetical protein
MPDPADTSSSVEEPPVKPAEDGGTPAPSDGSTSAGGAQDPMAPDVGAEAGSDAHRAPSRPSAGPPTDPGTTHTG